MIMELSPPPPYPGPMDPNPPVQVLDAMYPPPPQYSAAVGQPVPTIMQPDHYTGFQPVAIQVQRQHAVMVVNPVVVQPGLKDVPTPMTCAYCQQQIVTLTKPANGLLVWTVFGVLLLCGIWPCCLIPFFFDSCKDIQHVCPKCRNVLHIYRRM